MQGFFVPAAHRLIVGKNTNPRTSEHYYKLRYNEDRLELIKTGGNAPGPIFCDFVTGKIGYRLVHGRNKRQPLARALGLKGNPDLKVIDATAGMGRDAMMLASLGCFVLMLERSPIIAALLEDGLKRAAQTTALGPLVKKRVRLIHTDAITYLDNLSQQQRPDVVYLDPMYPPRTKNAKVKKEMQILRDLLGNDSDAAALLHASLNCAKNRVVVKRPRFAEPLSDAPPTRSAQGKTTRYDIYTHDQ